MQDENKTNNSKNDMEVVTEEEIQVKMTDEVFVPPSKTYILFDKYLSLRSENSYFKIFFHLTTFATFIVIAFDVPYQISMYQYLDVGSIIVLSLNFIIYTFDIIAKLIINGFIGTDKSFIKNGWNVIQLIFSLLLITAITFKILQMLGIVLSPYIIESLTRMPLAIIIIMLIPDYVNINLNEVFTSAALSQISKVLVFSVYFYIIFTLLGIQLIGGVTGVCMIIGDNIDVIGDTNFTIPLIYCNLYDPNIGYRCPMGFQCVDYTTYSLSDGNLYFDNFFNGIMFVYQGSIMDSWSNQFRNSMQTSGLVTSTIFFVSLILFSAWLVRNIFVAVVTQVLSEALAYEPPQPQYDLDKANFGLTLIIEDGVSILKDISENKKLDNIFVIILKAILKSSIWSIFVSGLIITDVVLLSTIGSNTYWQMTLASFFLFEALLELAAFGISAYSPLEWVIGHFLFPFLNITAVVLNEFNYYQLDIFYALRVIKIINVHTIIFDYIIRILGNYTRFAASVILALGCLITLSSISLQIYAGIPTSADPLNYVISNFPDCFHDIFIIFLQGGAFSTLLSLAGMVSFNLSYFVILYFVGCHFLSNTIMMSVFITFILANLELSEEEIKAKQKEIIVTSKPLDEYAGNFVESQIFQMSDELTDDFLLPYRFWIYRKFKNSPKTALVPKSLQSLKFPRVNKRFLTRYLSEGYPVLDERFYIKKQFENDPDISRKYLITKNYGFTDEDLEISEINTDSSWIMALLNNLNLQTSPLLTPTTIVVKNNISSTSFGIQSTSQSSEEKEIMMLQQKIDNFVVKRKRLIDDLREQHPLIDKSLFILSKTNILRKIMGKIVNAGYASNEVSSSFVEIFSSQTYFEWFMILFTITSTILMMMETSQNMVFDISYTTIFEYIYVSVNLLEIIMKIMTRGMFLTPSALITDSTAILNILIGIIGITHLIYFIQISPSNKFIYQSSYTNLAIAIRVVRCLRPLRIIILTKSLFRVIVLLISGWKTIAKVFSLLLTLILFFAYFGYLSFKGRLQRCNDQSIKNISQCTYFFNATLSPLPIFASNPNYISVGHTIMVPRLVVGHSRLNFDNFGYAYLSSYILLTLDYWTSSMNYVKSVVGTWVTLYFYGYVFFANLVGVSMFVGVVCQSYNINTGVALLTTDQKNWSNLTQKIDLTSPIFIPHRPLNRAIAILYDIVMSLPYRLIHTLVTCVSPILLIIHQFNNPSLSDKVYIDYLIILGCHIYFIIDIILKVISFGFITYIRGLLNKCDILIVTGTIICCSIQLTTISMSKTINDVTIALICSEFVLLSTRWDFLSSLMLTFVMSVVKSLSAITVMFIIMITYSLIGNILFGRVKFGLILNKYINYTTSFNILYILYILATGDNWSAYLIDASIQQPFCTYDPNFPVQSDCGSQILAIVYFISYLLIIQNMILNLFIATVLSNFAVFCASDDVSGRFKPSDIITYLNLWSNYDRKQKSKISRNYARMLCFEYFTIKNYTETEDLFLLLQLYEEIDRYIKQRYDENISELSEADEYKNKGTISFKELMFILATRLTDIKVSFKTNELLNRISIQDDISENVSATIINRWYHYIKSLKRKDTEETDDDNIPFTIIKDDIEISIMDFPKSEISNIYSPDLMKRELDRIEAETQTVDTEEIERFCNRWHDEYLRLVSSDKPQ